MKELEFLEIIKNTLSINSYLGDDCAYLKDLNIAVTQDSLVEDIHFSFKFSTPYQLGHKSIVTNLSDIFASGAIPKYITISLSLPKETESNFVKEFYSAVNTLANQFDFQVIGGDITGGSKCFISVCAIGITINRNISSRAYANVGDYIITTGVHGSSAAGLWLLKNNFTNHEKLIKSHISPIPNPNLSAEIATKITRNYAMMDTSDGLADALYKIGQASNVLLSVDFDKIPYDNDIEKIAKDAKINYKDWILYGGEDYQLIACLDEENLNKINPQTYTIIGQVKEKKEENFVEIKDNENLIKIFNLESTFNHFSN